MKVDKTEIQELGLNAVKELGRWSELKLVERYSHVSKDHRTRVISKLDSKFQDDDED